MPLSEKALSLTPDDIAVVEVSSFQLETTKRLCPDIAVLTNVTSDHLDRHKTLDNYKNLKAKLFEGQCDREISVFNADDETSEEISKIVKSDKFFFSTKKRVRGAYLDGDEIVFEDEKRIHIANCGELSACAGVNLENVLATTATCMARKINPEIIRMTLKSFAAPLYRTTYLGEKRGKKFYNDSKGTNISATLKSAESMTGNTVLILGGRGKGENFEDLFKKTSEKCNSRLYYGRKRARNHGRSDCRGFLQRDLPAESERVFYGKHGGARRQRFIFAGIGKFRPLQKLCRARESL